MFPHEVRKGTKVVRFTNQKVYEDLNGVMEAIRQIIGKMRRITAGAIALHVVPKGQSHSHCIFEA